MASIESVDRSPDEAQQGSPLLRLSGSVDEYAESMMRDSIVPADFRNRQAMSKSSAARRLVVNFSPSAIEKHIDFTQNQFFEKNSFKTEVEFLQVLDSLVDKITATNCSPTLAATLTEASRALHELESKKSNFDEPSRFIHLAWMEGRARNTSDRTDRPQTQPSPVGLTLTSELVVNAALSDQKEFIVTVLNDDKKVSSWEEMQAIGMVYWFSNATALRTLIDELWAKEYKQSKDPWKILFWVIVSGKPKVMAGLLKVQPDTHKFVAFFNEDFSTESSRNKAVNNAFQLRSKKRFIDSAAFFILAKRYREAMEVLLESLRNLQLVVLVFRLFEVEIRNSAEELAYFESVVRQCFISPSLEFRDDFLPVIGHLLLEDNRAVVRGLREYRSGDLAIRALDTFRQLYGFSPTPFSFSIAFLPDFMRKNGRFRAFFGETPEEAVGDDVDDMFDRAKRKQKPAGNFRDNLFDLDEEEMGESEVVASVPSERLPTVDLTASVPDQDQEGPSRVRFLSVNQQHFLALLELISIKSRKPNSFATVCQSNKHYIKHSLCEVIFKKLAKLISSQAYLKISVVWAEASNLSAYFGVNAKKVLERVTQRIRLLNDSSLDLAMLSCSRNETEVRWFNEDLLQRTIKGCFSMIKKGQFVLLDARYWMKRLFYISSIVKTLKLFTALGLEGLVENFSDTFTGFNEILNALLKLVVIRSMCFDETLELIQIKADLPVTCNDFDSLLTKAGLKIKRMYPFSLKKGESVEPSLGSDGERPFDRHRQSQVIRAAQALSDENPDNERRVRELFLRMNQLEITKPVNTAIADLGLADFVAHNNLCLQLLLEMTYVVGFFFSDDMTRNATLVKVEVCFESVFSESLKNFVLMVSEQSTDDQSQFLSELCNVLENNETFLTRNAFMHIQPTVALNMDFNKQFMMPPKWTLSMRRLLEDLKVFLLFNQDLDRLSDFQKKVRLETFGKGVQVFRPKLEQNSNIFKQRLFKRVTHSSAGESEEVYVLAEKRLRKVFLFSSLFKANRADEYFTLTHAVS